MEPSDYTQSSSDKDKLAYFQPGEIVYLVTHRSEQLRDDQIDSLIDWSKNRAGDPELGDLHLTISRRPGEVLRFPGTPSELQVKQTEYPPDIRYRSPEVTARGPFTLIPADVKDKDDPTKYVERSRLVDLIIRLDENRRTVDLVDGASLEVVSPNWLSSPGSEWGGTGGPGGRPTPFKGPRPPDKTQYEFQLPPKIEAICPEKDKRGEGVIVAILDTAPCLHDLAAAYEKWQKVDPAGNPPKPYGLIETLLKPNGPLTVHPASYEELLRMRSVHLEDHNYKMTDHGLFVAGIIHSIARAAEIHLYEVLNPDGVGDLTSIASGLLKVFESFSGEPLVVNCSLVLNIPLGEYSQEDLDSPNPDRLIRKVKTVLPLRGHRHKDLDRKLLEYILGDPKWLERIGALMEWICDLLFWRGSRVIAAAGNDWSREEDEGRPQARYPAAFNSALGIGALPKGQVTTPAGKRETSSYSNLSDAPGDVGVTTLGGEPGEEQGVLGIYLGKFPSPHARRRNTKHWAWWAGTSFATPIVTGAIAAILSAPAKPATTEDAIVRMYGAGVIVNDRTDYQEDILDVTQG